MNLTPGDLIVVPNSSNYSTWQFVPTFGWMTKEWHRGGNLIFLGDFHPTDEFGGDFIKVLSTSGIRYVTKSIGRFVTNDSHKSR